MRPPSGVSTSATRDEPQDEPGHAARIAARPRSARRRVHVELDAAASRVVVNRLADVGSERADVRVAERRGRIGHVQEAAHAPR